MYLICFICIVIYLQNVSNSLANHIYFVFSSMIHRLRRQKRLNNKSFRCLLVPVIEHLDLGSIYITEATIKMVAQRCPNVRVLTLRDTGYMLTDNLMEWLLKVCIS